jgi:XTP/dITP diphosphohydrolase
VTEPVSASISLLLATGNPGKVREVREILAPAGVVVLSQAEVPELAGGVVEETGATFAANALLKARWAGTRAGRVAVADDSGLVVDALGGAPGVLSARYAGVGATDAANNSRLLAELAAVPPAARTARFVCAAVVFVPAGVEAGPLAVWRARAEPGTVEEAEDGVPVGVDEGAAVVFRGVLEGRILEAPRGSGGFGYDPLFVLPELGLTTAELTAGQKNGVSHRGQAFGRLARAIRSLTGGGRC